VGFAVVGLLVGTAVGAAMGAVVGPEVGAVGAAVGASVQFGEKHVPGQNDVTLMPFNVSSQKNKSCVPHWGGSGMPLHV
jgi:hypothetical protein